MTQKARLPHIRLITLDLDDTLWPVRSIIDRAEGRLQAWLAENCPATAALCERESLQTLRQEVLRQCPELRTDFAALRKASIRLALQRAGEPEEYADAAFAAFWTARHDVECYADVLPALDRLKARYKLAAITNGNTDIRRTPLARYFEFSICGNESGHYKPARPIFRVACARAGVSPEEALHAGDDIDCDVRGALSVGMHAAWVNRDVWSLRLLSPPAITVPHLGALADRLLS